MQSLHGALAIEVGDMPVFGAGIASTERQYLADERTQRLQDAVEPMGRAATCDGVVELVSDPED